MAGKARVLRFSRDSSTLLAIHDEGAVTIRLGGLETKTVLGRGDSRVAAGGDSVFARVENASVAVYDARTASKVWEIPVKEDIYKILLSEDGKLLAVNRKPKSFQAEGVGTVVDLYSLPEKRLLTTIKDLGNYRSHPGLQPRREDALLEPRPGGEGDRGLQPVEREKDPRSSPERPWRSHPSTRARTGPSSRHRGREAPPGLEPQNGKSVQAAPFDGEEWFLSDDRGRFACSDGGRKFVRFLRGGEVYDAAQFWDSFYYPDLGSSLAAGKEPLSGSVGKLKTATTLGDAAKNMPKVSITNPAKAFTSEADTLTLTVVADGPAGVGKIFLYRNGRVFEQGSRSVTIVAKGNTADFTVKLQEGANEFRAAAFDPSNGVEGRSEPLVVTYRPKNAEAPDLYCSRSA